jgi:hypothetical protein
MKYQIENGSFNVANNKVYLRGSFNDWDTSNQMTSLGDGVYSITLNLQGNSAYYFKFFTDAPGFPNSGWENTVGVGIENRNMYIGTNDLELAKLYFNNANMKLRLSTSMYKLYCDDVDIAYIDSMKAFYDDHFTRITNAIETTIGTPVNIWFYPDQKTYFIMYGYPESPSWAIGSAIGRDHIVTFSPRYFANLEDCLGNTCHEFTHSCVAWKMGSQMPVWLNEGAACFYAGDGLIRPIGSVRYNVNERRGGSKPPLSYIEEGDFAANDGYPLSHSIADFIFTKHGQHAMADFIGNIDYSALGYGSKLDFEKAWHQHLDKYYLDPQADIKIKVDMGYYISKGMFDPDNDKVSVGGEFSHWYSFEMQPEGNGIYSFVTTNPHNSSLQYKFKITNKEKPEGEWEGNVGDGTNGCRILTVAESNVTTLPILFNNLNPTLILTYPLGGELLVSGDSISISWKYTSIPNIKIEYTTDNENTWNVISSSCPSSNLSFKWKVPDITDLPVRIRISDVTDSSAKTETTFPISIVSSNERGGPFIYDNNTIALFHFNMDFKNRGNYFAEGQPNNSVAFSSSADITLGYCVNIDNSNPAVSSNVEIPYYEALSLKNDWTIEFWFKINSWGSGSTEYPFMFIKTGANYFFSPLPGVKSIMVGYDFEGGAETVVFPDNSLSVNKWYHITFIRNTVNTTLKCFLHDSEMKFLSSASKVYNKSHLPKTNSDPIRLGGFSSGSNCQFDGCIDELRISNVVREYRKLNVSSFNNAEILTVGDKEDITWTCLDILKVKLEYSNNNGSTWTTIANNIDAASGKYTWAIPNNISSDCKIRITDQDDASFYDISDKSFSIIPKEIPLNLTYPLGGETFVSGDSVLIRWENSTITNVKVEYSTDNGTTWNIISSSYLSSKLSIKWKVPDIVSYAVKIRISDQNNASSFDITDNSFSIIQKEEPVIVTVEFSVDLNYQIEKGIFNPSKDKVYIKGSFNGWGELNQMTDNNGSGVYTCTITLDPSTKYEYKYFINSAGAENSGWELNVSEGDNGNRSVTTGNAPMVHEKEYFNNLMVSVNNMFNPTSLEIYPNPVNDRAVLTFNIEKQTVVSLKVYDVYGRLKVTLADGFLPTGKYTFEWNASSEPRGIYFGILKTEQVISTKKIVVR